MSKLTYKEVWAAFCPADKNDIQFEHCPWCGNKKIQLEASLYDYGRKIQLCLRCPCRMAPFYSVIRSIHWEYYDTFRGKYERGSYNPDEVKIEAMKCLMQDWNTRCTTPEPN